MRLIAKPTRYRRYQQSAKGKATARKYRTSPKGRQTKSRWRKLYRQRPDVKAKQIAYAKSRRDRTNELKRAQRATESGKAKTRLENKLRHHKKLQWAKEHREVGRVQCVKRRARLWNATVPNVEQAILKIYARAKQLRKWFNVVVDHIVPLSKGGLHAPDNLQIIYRSENAIKNDRLDYKPRLIFA